MTPTLHLSGPEAETLRAEAKTLFAELSDGEITETEQHAEGTKREPLGIALGVIAIIMAAPGAWRDWSELADRNRVRERIEALLTKLGTQQADAVLRAGDDELVLNGRNSDEVMNFLRKYPGL